MNQGAGMYKDILVTIRYDTDTIWYTCYKRRPTYVTNMDIKKRVNKLTFFL